jgi:16S rRNA (guanine966-N2)-methyltransferase
MRIIAGRFRGRKLLPPATDATRPVTDRVKQSVFDILAPIVEGAIVYDCFAGTGSMGLECLSRGASHVTFFEGEPTAAARLKTNIRTLDAEGVSTVIAGDLFRWFAHSTPLDKATLVFLDPPYRFLNERAEDLRSLAAALAGRHLMLDGTVVFRHDARDSLDLPALVSGDMREYGGMVVEFLSPRVTPPVDSDTTGSDP